MDKERNMETLGQSAAVPVQKGFLNHNEYLKFLSYKFQHSAMTENSSEINNSS